MKVSVVIPCYNAEAYLAQTLGSVLEQTHPPHEIIVVDDGSTDGSLAIARRFAACDETIQVFSERSGQAARTRNLGAARATGDALMFLDADDVLGPGVLEALYTALHRQPGGIAMSPWYRLDAVGERWVAGPASCKPRRPGQDTLSAWLTGWYHPPCSVLWSREAFERAGRWDERWNPNDDGDLMMRALALGVPVAETSDGASYYRRLPEGEQSLSGARFDRNGLAERIRTVRKVASFLEEHARVQPYRAALSQSLRLIARDAEGHHPNLYEEAMAWARHYAPPPWVGAAAHVRWTLRQRGKQLYYALRRRLGAMARSGTSGRTVAHRDRGEEVRHGLAAAARVLEAAPPGERAAAPAPLPPSPLVSVIIPTYNRAALLARALDSVRAQTFGDFEVLVIDDGSTDETEAVVTGYDDPRVRYLRQPENGGVSAARNRGLREARGTFVAFLDSDDVWFPDKLDLQIRRFRDLPEAVGLLYGGVEDDYGNGRRELRTPSHRGDLYEVLLRHNVIHGTSGVMIRRNVVATAGFFDEQIPAIEDYDYWLRIARFYRVDFVDEPLILYHDPRVEQARAGERKSLAADANLAARAYFFRKHQAAMRRAGVAHLFLLTSAKRHLLPASYAPWAARLLTLQALREAPTSRTAYRMLRRVLVPNGIRGRLQQG